MRLLPDGDEWYGRYDTWRCMQELVERLERFHEPPAPPEDRFYAWQPLPPIDFLAGMSLCGSGGRFLDVGSGLGSKLALAASLGWEASGLERHGPYAEVSRSLYPHPVTITDAFEFEGYGEFDLVYCYRICIDSDDQQALNRHIADRLRPGTLFFAAGGPYPDWLTPVGHQVWRA